MSSDPETHAAAGPASPTSAPPAICTPPQQDSRPETSTTSVAEQRKPIHSLVLDTGPLIKNEVSASALRAQAEALYTIPAVLDEVRDAATRARLEGSLLPFLTLRTPRASSVATVSAFARRTGDLEVLSRPDLHLLALTYELECERNGGDWRLRRDPGQKGLNGRPPQSAAQGDGGDTAAVAEPAEGVVESASVPSSGDADDAGTTDPIPQSESHTQQETAKAVERIHSKIQDLAVDTSQTETLSHISETQENPATNEIADTQNEDNEEEEDSDSDGWITPSNLAKHQARDAAGPSVAGPQNGWGAAQRTLQACLLTTDMAMQNVALRMNLNVVAGPALARVARVRTWVLRCHGCFAVSRRTDRQFCAGCGQATLTRVACSTGPDGVERLHLRQGYQYNKRGNVYSIPKPVGGSASGKVANVHGGGKGGWGTELILAEDQKEYTRKREEEARARHRDLMDEDYLPDLLSGRRSGGHSKIKIGPGRNVNSKKRR